MAVKRFAVSIPERIAKRFDESMETMEHGNRSKAVAEALMEFTEKKLRTKDVEVGALLIKGGNGMRIKTKLDRIKNHYEDTVLSTFRDTEKNTFIDIWIVKGKGCVLTRLKLRLNKVHGIAGCWIYSLKNGIASNDCESKARMALEEDIGTGDITSENIIPENAKVDALIIAKESGILCGTGMFVEKFLMHDLNVIAECVKKDGERIEKGEPVLRLRGPARSILACERTTLNLIMRMSGIATNASRFVENIKPYKAELFDTRKTVPGYRMLDKYAVKVGGGHNHRMGLYDGILIKNNHIDIIGSVREAIKRAKRAGKPIEVEVRDLDELREALQESPEMILLDNMGIDDIGEAVRITNGKTKLEASGGVTLDNINRIAATGVDRISVGSALTLSAKALDFSLEIKEKRGGRK